MSDFWLGLIIGYVIGGIVSFIIECLCIVSGRSDIDTWMYEEKDIEPPNEPIHEDKNKNSINIR